ncbi:hypothetical protein GF339_15825 [candidate division KSB3 bacterium]|uniref:Uncharacterized protein n=1 Tax=candidate division KSB3 bacterium TaxID=2044937 RepID=A0A9D5Q6N8_9BACT|nr:hypothetical protein [candidate division KSB3 bacterium]MBD3326054.1 hypothetical protein [candidate division KSB3 bacterium]
MNTKQSKPEDFEFAFQNAVSDVEDGLGEEDLDVSPDEFQLEGEEVVDKTEVIILTTSHYIRGKIALVPGARLTDYIVEANLFVAVADVEVRDRQGRLILTSPFLDVHRDHIEIILPADLADLAPPAA